MATYPAALPTFPPTVPTVLAGSGAGTAHSNRHLNAEAEVAAIAAELGVEPSGTYATVVARLNALPRGVVASASVTASQGSITTVTDLTGLSVSFTAEVGRKYRVTAAVEVLDSASSSVYVVSVKDGAFTLHRSTGVNGHTGSVTNTIVTPPISSYTGARTWKLTLERASGTGTLSTTPSATYPAHITVEDIGAV